MKDRVQWHSVHSHYWATIKDSLLNCTLIFSFHINIKRISLNPPNSMYSPEHQCARGHSERWDTARSTALAAAAVAPLSGGPQPRGGAAVLGEVGRGPGPPPCRLPGPPCALPRSERLSCSSSTALTLRCAVSQFLCIPCLLSLSSIFSLSC